MTDEPGKFLFSLVRYTRSIAEQAGDAPSRYTLILNVSSCISRLSSQVCTASPSLYKVDCEQVRYLEEGFEMPQRHQRGWLKKELHSQGETWVLFFRTIRGSDGTHPVAEHSHPRWRAPSDVRGLP
jgi:hypothetical protein